MRIALAALAALAAVVFASPSPAQTLPGWPAGQIGRTLVTPIGSPQKVCANSGTTTVSTKTCTTTAGIQSGDLVVISISFYNAGTTAASISSVSDGTNSYTLGVIGTPGTSSTASTALYYCQNCTAVSSGATITVNWGANTFGQVIIAARVSGILTSGSLDKTNTSGTTTNSPSVSTGTLTNGNEIVWCATGGYNLTGFTEDSGNSFTNIDNIATGSQFLGTLSYRIVTSTASITCAPTTTGAAGSTPIVVGTFKGN